MKKKSETEIDAIDTTIPIKISNVLSSLKLLTPLKMDVNILESKLTVLV